MAYLVDVNVVERLVLRTLSLNGPLSEGDLMNKVMSCLDRGNGFTIATRKRAMVSLTEEGRIETKGGMVSLKGS